MQRTSRQPLGHLSARPTVARRQDFDAVRGRAPRQGGQAPQPPRPSRSSGPRGPHGPIQFPLLPLLIAGGVVSTFLVVSLVGALGMRLIGQGRLYDNLYVNDANFGGMTQADARTKLATMLAPVIDTPITLSYNGRNWTTKRADLGIRPDVDGTITEAYAVGRSEGPIGQFWRILQMKSGAKTHVPLLVAVDQPTLNGYLDRLQADIGTPPVDASVAIQNGMVVVVPGKDGIRLDREQVQGKVVQDLAHLEQTRLTLSVTFAPPNVNSDAAEAARARVQDWTSAPLVLTFGDKKWPLTQDLLLNAVRIGPAPQFALSLDPAVFKAKVNGVAAEVKQDPVDATIGWDNALVVRKASQNGQRLNVDETLKRIAAWQGGDRTIPLPVEVTQPSIPDDVSKLGITTRIGLGVSNFGGSDSSRANNITVAAKYLDNTVVAPGATFSFLDSIGEISKDRGYQDGYVILAEETVPGIGGGVCQVATTMFRAAMYTGLPIVERNPHAYIVSYYQLGGYPLGFDAAVFSPGVDLKFQNTTNSYLLIKTSIDSSANLYVSVYGPDLGYTVDIGKPVITNKTDPPDDEYQVDSTLPPGTKKQVEFAKFGEDVSLTRTVKDKSGNIVRDAKFFTNYQAWPNKFLVSPDRAPGNKATMATRSPNTPGPQTTLAAGAPTTAPTKPTNPPTKAPATAAAVMPTKPATAAVMPTPAAKATAKS